MSDSVIKCKSGNAINYDYFINQFLINKEENINNILNKEYYMKEKDKLNQISIFLDNIRTLLEKRKKYLKKHKTLKGQESVSSDEIENILYKGLENADTNINGFYYDYCYLDELDKNKPHVLYIILNILTKNNVFGFGIDKIKSLYFKDKFKYINRLIKDLIEDNVTLNILNDLNNHPSNKGDLYYYDDNDLFLIASDLKLKGSNIKINLGDNAERSDGNILIAFNDDNLINYKIGTKLLRKEGKNIIEYILKNNINKISKDVYDLDKQYNKECIVNIICKEVDVIETQNGFSRSFQMGKIEEIYNNESLNKRINNELINSFVIPYFFISVFINQNKISINNFKQLNIFK